MDKAETVYRKNFMVKQAKFLGMGPLNAAITLGWFLPKPNTTVLNVKNFKDKAVQMKNLVKLPKIK